MSSEFDFDNKIYISQIIPTVQGEGPLIGYPSLLIRLGGCNLRCKWCDTKYTWTPSGHEVFTDHRDILKKIKIYFDKYNIRNIMITGGEPLLYAKNKEFIKLIDYFADDWTLTVEFETNGSLLDFRKMDDYLIQMICDNRIQLNISPKLNRLFYKTEAEYDQMLCNLQTFVKFAYSNNLNSYNFKFVYENDEFINNFLKEFNIDELEDIYVMPHTPDRKSFNTKAEFFEVYNKKALETVSFCMINGFIYCPRTHLYLFDTENEEF